MVTVLTEPSDEEKDVVILGPGTQHYIIVEDKVPSPKDIFLGTRLIAKHVKTGKYTFAKVDAIDDDKYSVTFEGRPISKGKVAIESIRILDPPRFCGKWLMNTIVGKEFSTVFCRPTAQCCMGELGDFISIQARRSSP